MLIKLDSYRIFNAVSLHGSFSRAAKELFISQPAISLSIQQLEDSLGVKLFNRTTKGVTLTPEGKILFQFIHPALNLIQTGEDKINDLKNLESGKITIGVGDTISKHFLLPFLETFHIEYPNISFKLINGTTKELRDILKLGKIDVILCHIPLEDDQLVIIPCQTIQDIFVTGPKFSSNFTEAISLEELLKFPMICLDQESISRQFIDEYLKQFQLSLEPDFELGAHDLLLDFAKINLGIACVIKEFSLEYLENGLLTEIATTETIPTRGIGLCYLKSVSLSTASRAFVDTLTKKRS